MTFWTMTWVGLLLLLVPPPPATVTTTTSTARQPSCGGGWSGEGPPAPLARRQQVGRRLPGRETLAKHAGHRECVCVCPARWHMPVLKRCAHASIIIAPSRRAANTALRCACRRRRRQRRWRCRV
jgi:hypothetical protein